MFDRFKKNENDEVPEFATKREFNELKKLIDTHQDYLNNILVFHKLELTPYMELMRGVSYELLKLFDNICKKHDIEYWLDFGTLLGAVRHEDFIPWDDDLDVGMLRADYYRFLEVFPDEIASHDLNFIESWFKDPSWDPGTRRWYQINCKYKGFNGKFVGIDVFPYDYITEFDDGYVERFHKLRPNFFKAWKDDVSLEDALAESCKHLNLSIDKTDYFIASVDGGRFRTGSVFKILKTEDLMPLKRLKFGDHEYLVPNNPDNYLKEIYGKKYMQIGKSIKTHGRLTRYKKRPESMELLKQAYDELVRANEKY